MATPLIASYESDMQSGMHVNNFQRDIALSLWLRMRKVSSARLATDMKIAGFFDDVVLFDDDKREIHFIQSKHAIREDRNIGIEELFPRSLTSGFDLFKYVTSYLSVKHSFEREENEEKAYKKHFYIFTNRDVKFTTCSTGIKVTTIQREEVNEIFNFPGSKIKHLKLQLNKKAIDQIIQGINKYIIQIKKAIKELFDSGKMSEILKRYSTPLRDVLKIDSNMMCSFLDSFNAENTNVNVAQLFNMLQMDSFDMSKTVVIKDNFLQKDSHFELLPVYTSEENIYAFLDDFSLSVRLPSDMRPTIDSELRAWMKTCITPDILGHLKREKFDQVHTDLGIVFDKFNEPSSKGNMKRFLTNSLTEMQSEILNFYPNRSSVEMDELERVYIKRQLRFKESGKEDKFIGDDKIFTKSAPHQHILLVADPGMGKTSLLQFRAFEIQKQNKKDVFLVYFSTLVQKLHQIGNVSDFDDVLQILSAALSEENCDVIKNAPETPQDGDYSIVLLLDAFDDIHPKYTVEVLKMLEILSMKKSIQMIISSEMHVKELLQQKLKVRPMILEPFSEDDQISYLNKIWNFQFVKHDAEKADKHFSKPLWNNSHSSAFSNMSEMFGSPLMMKMLVEIYSDGLKQLLDKDTSDMQKFNIVHLYEQFVSKCFHTKFLEKYTPCYALNHEEINLLMDRYISEHEMLAMKLLDIDILKDLFRNPSYRKKYYEFRKRCQMGSEKSLLVKVVNNVVQFCHPSYCEYFAAKYLCDHICTLQPELIIGILSKFDSIRKFTMLRLRGQEEFFGILNKLCEKMWKIALWACESGCLDMVKALEGSFERFSIDKLNMMIEVSAKNGYDEICEFLINCDMNLDKSIALYSAAETGRVEVVKLLLSRNTEVNQPQTTEGKKTPLHIAVRNGHLEIVALLIEKSSDPDYVDEDQWTALHLAALNGHTRIVDLLLKMQASVDALEKDKWTALHLATQNGHVKVVNILIAKKGNTSSKTKDGRTPLHIAAWNGHFGIATHLLKKGTDPKMVDKDHWTALHSAAHNGHTAIVNLLLDNGAEVNAEEKDNYTPLHLAVQNGHIEVVKLLIKHSADKNSQTIGGRTPLHIAAWNGRSEIAELLMENNPNPNEVDEDQHTALHAAAENGHLDVVKLLLPHQVNAKGKQQWTALHLAAQNGHEAVVDLLLQNKADVTAEQENKFTALHLAAANGRSTVVDILLQYKADVNCQGKDYWTAFHLAAKNGYEKVIKAMIKYENTMKKIHPYSHHSSGIILIPKNLKLRIVQKHTMGKRILKQNRKSVNKPLRTSCLFLYLSDYRDATINSRIIFGRTPLHIAAQNGHKDIVELLIQCNWDLNVVDNNGWNALHIAAANGHSPVVELLLQKKKLLNIDAKDKSQRTALHLAAEKGDSASVKHLINSGANINCHTKDDKTLLHIARQNCQQDVTDLLIKKHTVGSNDTKRKSGY